LPQKRGVAGSDGASGAIYATLAFFGGLFPTQKFLFFFVIPMPAWFLIGGIFAVSRLEHRHQFSNGSVGSLRHL
jgi:membrane associated rhomboid family serine protease